MFDHRGEASVVGSSLCESGEPRRKWNSRRRAKRQQQQQQQQQHMLPGRISGHGAFRCSLPVHGDKLFNETNSSLVPPPPPPRNKSRRAFRGFARGENLILVSRAHLSE